MKLVGLFIAFVLVIMSIQGCAVHKELVPTGGSRADGTIKLSYEVGKYEEPQINWQQGLDAARRRCAAWGYTDAEAFGGFTKRCILASGFGCSRWIVTHEYQCTGTPVASRGEERSVRETTSQSRPPATAIASVTSENPSGYWCSGLGVLVKTEGKTTITEIAQEGESTARTCLKAGDEIIKVGKVYIDGDNARQVLIKPISTENDGLVPVVIRRDGKYSEYRIKPNVF